MLYKSRELGIKLFNNYYLIVSEVKYKAIHEKEIAHMLICVACVAKVSDFSNLKILSHKQMLQILSIALAQVKVGNTYQNLLNQIRSSINSLYRAKQFTKKVYNNKINSIK